MSTLRTTDRPAPRFVGRPALFVAPADADPFDPAARTPLAAGRNVVCFGMYDAIQHGFMLRSFDAWAPASIALGFGGDYDQPDDPDATAPTDQGRRVDPQYSDAYVRKQFHVAAVRQVREGLPTSDRRAVFVAVIRPDDGTTDAEDAARPFLNEFGLLSRNGTLLAHFVPEADPDTGRARRYAKSSALWLVIEWTVELVGMTA